MRRGDRPRAQALLLALLLEHPRQLIVELRRQHHAVEADIRVPGSKQAGQRASGLHDRNRPGPAPRDSPSLALGSVDQLTKLLGKLAVTLTRLVRGKLRRHREEAILISGDVALQQCNDVARRRHGVLIKSPKPGPFDPSLASEHHSVSPKSAQRPNSYIDLATFVGTLPQPHTRWLRRDQPAASINALRWVH